MTDAEKIMLTKRLVSDAAQELCSDISAALPVTMKKTTATAFTSTSCQEELQDPKALLTVSLMMILSEMVKLWLPTENMMIALDHAICSHMGPDYARHTLAGAAKYRVEHDIPDLYKALQSCKSPVEIIQELLGAADKVKGGNPPTDKLNINKQGRLFQVDDDIASGTDFYT